MGLKRMGRFVIVSPSIPRFHTVGQAKRYLYKSYMNAGGRSEYAIGHVVENCRQLEGDARPFIETPKTRIRRLLHTKLDPLYASRKAWTTKLKRATTALRRLKRRIAWYESHTGS